MPVCLGVFFKCGWIVLSKAHYAVSWSQSVLCTNLDLTPQVSARNHATLCFSENNSWRYSKLQVESLCKIILYWTTASDQLMRNGSAGIRSCDAGLGEGMSDIFVSSNWLSKSCNGKVCGWPAMQQFNKLTSLAYFANYIYKQTYRCRRRPRRLWHMSRIKTGEMKHLSTLKRNHAHWCQVSRCWYSFGTHT